MEVEEEEEEVACGWFGLELFTCKPESFVPTMSTSEGAASRRLELALWGM